MLRTVPARKFPVQAALLRTFGDVLTALGLPKTKSVMKLLTNVKYPQVLVKRKVTSGIARRVF
jgi:hypothetical protein